MIYLTGASGMLGSYVNSYLSKFHKVRPVYRNDIFPTLKKNDIVINCAGLIKQKINSDNVQDAIQINSIFPLTISKLCENAEAKFIHISTDCVYDGKQLLNNELTITNPSDVYGMSKCLGDRHNGTIIRTSVIGESKKNKLSLLEWLKCNKNGRVEGFTNHYWNGLTCLELAKYINILIDNQYFWKGVHNVFSNGLKKYELLKLINDIYELNITIEPVAAKEPINRVLSSIYYEGVGIQDIERQLIELHEYGMPE